jgi:hypothetical protein
MRQEVEIDETTGKVKDAGNKVANKVRDAATAKNRKAAYSGLTARVEHGALQHAVRDPAGAAWRPSTRGSPRRRGEPLSFCLLMPYIRHVG